jgi:AcrR family transcriptional regulator
VLDFERLMGYKERRQKEKDATREKIMNTALNIAIAEDWNAVTIRKIAEKIEYAPPIVYEYFKNKEDLLDELVHMGHRMLHAQYRLSKKEQYKARQSIIILSVCHWDFAFNNKKLYQLMFGFGRRVPSKETKKIIDEVRFLFREIAYDANDVELSDELLMNWVCLIHGYIFSTMQMGLPPELSHFTPKLLFINAVKRFLN